MKILKLIIVFLITSSWCSAQIKDVFYPLPANSVRFNSYFENDIQNSISHWNKGVVPYSGFVKLFRNGSKLFAQGEMWGKAVRSGCMFYRYIQDPELKSILKATVYDLLSTKRSNGSISCAEVSKQPDGPNGDLWERKYVLLGLLEYYNNVDKDPLVLKAMCEEADCTISQIGPSPKVRITDQGWSPNHIESSTILEPIMKLYNLTKDKRYLDFARYIVEEEGGAKGYKIFEDAFNDKYPEQIGGSYPKAYEMTSLFEGLVEYYRVTGNEYWKRSFLNFFKNVWNREITIIGNGGGDQPYHPAVYGEAWDNTALEQTNPNIQRMMETCTGITWLKFCSQVLRVTGDPLAVDAIEKYAYNGLLGAMKPEGDGFSYVNLLNGLKTVTTGWGAVVDDVNVTCCNLNGPMGLAYLPFVAIMNSDKGPVINLYNEGTATVLTSGGGTVKLKIVTDFPKSGKVNIRINPQYTNKAFSVRIRIPGWSKNTILKVNGKIIPVIPGTYAEVNRTWSSNDKIELLFDMRCKLIDAPHGSNRAGDNYQALMRGPIVLARDENIDVDYNKPVAFKSVKGYVDAIPEQPTLKSARMQFRVPTKTGFIHMVDYSSVNSWNGKHICTWLPKVVSKENGSACK